jgi:archaellum component FlaC
MSTSPAATREDIDDVLQVLDIMMTKIDERFTKVENGVTETQKQTQHILNHLDSLEKRLEISDDERLIMAHQLTQLHDWVEQAAKRIDLKFAH